jgi:hypothetical protein
MSKKCFHLVKWFMLAFSMLLLSGTALFGQTTSFTYQGSLTDGGAPANGSYDLQFALWDNLSNGTQIGSTQTLNALSVINGGFTVNLDFGVSAFPGANRFLEISVRTSGTGAFTTLTPRQQISSTPYAIRTLSAMSADTATNANQLGGVAANQFVQTNDSRLSDARAPTAGSANYIQNTTAQQASSNFNITGNGFVGGNVGIGTAAPTARLEVQSTGSVNAISGTSSSGDAVTAKSSNSTGVLATGGATGVWGVSTGGVGVLGQTGKGGIAIEAVGSSFFQGDTTPLSGTVAPGGTGVVIGTSPTPDIGYLFAYDYGARVPRTLAINHPGGLVGIGTTEPDTQLTVFGNVDKPGGGSWGTFSDERLKNLKGRFTSGLNAVMRLQPLRYEYKPDNALGIKSEGEFIGFSAQQVLRIIPEAVSADQKGYLLVNNDPILWTMLNAIKEQQAQIEKQQEQIQRQEKLAWQQRAAFAAQEEELKALKSLVCHSPRHASVCK